MVAYAPYYEVSEHCYKILSFDAERARQVGGYLYYSGMIYGPVAECYTDRIGAEMYILKEYGVARKYQKKLSELQRAAV